MEGTKRGTERKDFKGMVIEPITDIHESREIGGRSVNELLERIKSNPINSVPNRAIV